MDLLDQLPGLDLPTGLRCVRGDRASYLDVLRLFITTNRGEPAHLRTHLSSGKCVPARQIAHRIKGSAITLGLSQIADIAGRLDHRLREPCAIDADLLADAEQLGKVLATLDEALTHAASPP